MLKIPLSKERKILLAVGGVLLLFGLAYRMVPFSREFGDGNAELMVKKEQIAKYLKRIQDKENLEKRQLVLTKAVEQLKQGLLKGQTPALAAVSLQNWLNETADRISVEIQSTRVLGAAPIENDAFMAVPLQLSMNLTVRQLKSLFYAIESSESFLHVTQLRLKRLGEGLPVMLQVGMTITGYMQPPGAE